MQYAPQSIFESKEAIAAIKAGHDAACRLLDRRRLADIPDSDPNHPKYSVAS